MRKVNLKLRDLLAGGVHFGHQKRKWNAKMKPYVLCRKKGVDMVDLRETIKGVMKAKALLSQLASNGGEFLFVGTKLAASEAVKDAAERCSMHYVNYRWLGGTLTNFETVLARIDYLDKLERMEKDGAFEHMTKKEKAGWEREVRKSKRNLQGIRRMQRLPSAVIVVDPVNERNAVKEASLMEIPIVAIIDTDGDPDDVDIPIPANDESVHAIRSILDELVESILEGRGFYESGPKGETSAEEVTEGTESGDDTLKEDKEQEEASGG